MKRSQSGFTLIELVVVIVLLGILGVTALGRFQDLSQEANTAALSGVQSEFLSASSVNYAASVVPGSTPAVDIDSTNNACGTILAGLMQNGALPTGYTTTGNVAPACAAAGDSTVCVVTQTSTGNTANVSLICTGG